MPCGSFCPIITNPNEKNTMGLYGRILVLLIAYLLAIIRHGSSELNKKKTSTKNPTLVKSASDVTDGVGLLWETGEGEFLCFQVDGWEGRGDKVVLYMAGLMGSRLESFRSSASSKEKKLLITIDRPGLGCTPTWGEGGGNTRYVRVADAALGLVEGLGVGGRGIEVVGWSSGGAFALAVGTRGGEGGVCVKVNRISTVASDPQWAVVSWPTLLANPAHIGLYAVVKLKVPRRIIARGALLVVELLQGLEGLLGISALRDLNCNFGESMKNGMESALAVAEEIGLERSKEVRSTKSRGAKR